MSKLIRLRTYPELVDVAISTNSRPSDRDPRAAVEGTAYIEIHPSKDLPNRWYILSVDRMPEGIRPVNTLKPDPNLGALVSRFRVDSAPALWNVSVGSEGRVSLDISEGIFIKESEISKVVSVSDATGKVCQLRSSGLPEGYNGRLMFDCDARIWADKRLHLTVRPGLLSGAKIPLGIFNPSATKQDELISQTSIDTDIDFRSAQPCDTTGGLCAIFPPR